MRFILPAIAIATWTGPSFIYGAPILLDQGRFVHVDARLAGHQLFWVTEQWPEVGERSMEVTGESAWLDWHAELEASQYTDIFANGVWGMGQVGVFSNGSRHDSNSFDAMAASLTSGTFVLDVATPYEFYLRGGVLDSISAPTWTDVSFHLFGPNGLVESKTIDAGRDEYLGTGMLSPGEYHYDVGALATLRARVIDDNAFIDYTFWLILPEPTTLVLLIAALPLFGWKRKYVLN